VALKVLPLAATMDGKQLQRFQLEAHAAACLHHTNIVPVHAVGCERAVPFYAMQYIEGRSLAQLIAELRRHEGLEQGTMPGALLGEISTSTLARSLGGGRLPGEPGCRSDRDATTSPREQRDEPGQETPAQAPESRILTTRPRGESQTGSSTRSRAYVQT